jgi:hypothetical protein
MRNRLNLQGVFDCNKFLLPGAGLEPARTLPGPRDFKSVTYYLQQTLPGRKALYQRSFPRRYGAFLPILAAWFGYTVSYSLVTVATCAQTAPISFFPSKHIRFDNLAVSGNRNLPNTIAARVDNRFALICCPLGGAEGNEPLINGVVFSV